MNELSVIIPSYHSKALTLICIESFERFKSKGMEMTYIVIENSDDISYRDDVLNSATNVKWMINPTKLRGSDANADALRIGLKEVKSEFVFLCHCDTCVASKLFFDELLKKAKDGYRMVGTGLDNTRINACHISGIFVDTEIARSVDMFPSYQNCKMIMDVGDDITKYCRDNDIKHTCLNNTYNLFDEGSLLDDKYRGFRVNRSVNKSGEVLFMHLGRGIPKTQGVYKKEGRIYLAEWIAFCRRLLSDKS